jgi:hypothetical protein
MPFGMMRRTFTLAQANALVPYLLEQFNETRRLASELRTLRLDARERDHARALQSGGRLATPPPSDEIARRITMLEEQIRARIEETASLGIEVRRIDGLVDFPSWMEGQLAFLCWRFPEDKIGFWHPSTTGFDGRRQLPSDEDARPELN